MHKGWQLVQQLRVLNRVKKRGVYKCLPIGTKAAMVVYASVLKGLQIMHHSPNINLVLCSKPRCGGIGNRNNLHVVFLIAAGFAKK